MKILFSKHRKDRKKTYQPQWNDCIALISLFHPAYNFVYHFMQALNETAPIPSFQNALH